MGTYEGLVESCNQLILTVKVEAVPSFHRSFLHDSRPPFDMLLSHADVDVTAGFVANFGFQVFQGIPVHLDFVAHQEMRCVGKGEIVPHCVYVRFDL